MRYIVVCVFLNDTAPTAIYTLSLHDALPIFGRHDHVDSRVGAPQAGAAQVVVGQRERRVAQRVVDAVAVGVVRPHLRAGGLPDRKSTRLNSSHGYISYAVFCLKKKRRISCRT